MEYVYQIIISLIHQHVPCLSLEKLNKDIFNKISSYQLNTDYSIILIDFYIKMFFSNISKPSLDLKLKFIYILSIHIKIPIAYNNEYFSYYLNIVSLLIYRIKFYIEPEDNLIIIKSLLPILKKILLLLTNIYLYQKYMYTYKLMCILTWIDNI